MMRRITNINHYSNRKFMYCNESAKLRHESRVVATDVKNALTKVGYTKTRFGYVVWLRWIANHIDLQHQIKQSGFNHQNQLINQS